VRPSSSRASPLSCARHAAVSPPSQQGWLQAVFQEIFGTEARDLHQVEFVSIPGGDCRASKKNLRSHSGPLDSGPETDLYLFARHHEREYHPSLHARHPAQKQHLDRLFASWQIFRFGKRPDRTLCPQTR
jgi:hypothetical protein